MNTTSARTETTADTSAAPSSHSVSAQAVIMAVRYGLGRTTSAADEALHLIRTHFQDMTSHDQRTVINDLAVQVRIENDPARASRLYAETVALLDWCRTRRR